MEERCPDIRIADPGTDVNAGGEASPSNKGAKPPPLREQAYMEKRIIDHAASLDEAIELRDIYIELAAVEGIKGWLFGYERDPVAGPGGRHGYVIYTTSR